MNSADHFEAIVSEHYEPLYRFAMSLTRLESDAQDLTQQTFYVWAMKGHQLRDVSKVKSWLFTTLRRTFLTARRRQSRFPHEDLEEVAEQLPTVLPVLSAKADSALVLSALARVDEVYQAAVALFYLEDYCYKEIAAILEVPLGTVKSRIARGVAQLRDFLLSDGCSASPFDKDLIIGAAIADQPEAATENTLSPRRHCLAVEARDRGYEDWNFRSTLRREPSGAG